MGLSSERIRIRAIEDVKSIGKSSSERCYGQGDRRDHRYSNQRGIGVRGDSVADQHAIA